MTRKREPRLGAIELIELGRSMRGSSRPRQIRPFLSNYPGRGVSLGIGLADIGSFIVGLFEGLFNTLGSIVDLPLDILSQGTGILFDGLADLITNIPIVGWFAAQILLVGKAVIQWALDVPGLLLKGIGNLFGEVKQAIDATRNEDEKKADEKKAKDKILNDAEARGGLPLREQVQNMIEGSPVTTSDGQTSRPPNPPPPGSEGLGAPEKGDLEKVLEVGLPIAGAAALIFMAVG